MYSSEPVFAASLAPYPAVHLDGSTWLGLTNQSASLAAADSPFGIMSCWVNSSNFFNPNGLGCFFVDINNAFTSILAGGVNRPLLFLQNTGGTSVFEQETTSGFSRSGWVNILASWDTNHASGSRIFQMYFNDVSQSLTSVNDSGSAFNCLYNTDVAWQFFGATTTPQAGNSCIGDVADFQLWAGTFADFTVTANRRNFIDANGHVVPPAVAAGAFGPPTILFTGGASVFATNRGSGPATGVRGGALTDTAGPPQ